MPEVDLDGGHSAHVATRDPVAHAGCARADPTQYFHGGVVWCGVVWQMTRHLRRPMGDEDDQVSHSSTYGVTGT